MGRQCRWLVLRAKKEFSSIGIGELCRLVETAYFSGVACEIAQMVHDIEGKYLVTVADLRNAWKIGNTLEEERSGVISYSVEGLFSRLGYYIPKVRLRVIRSAQTC